MASGKTALKLIEGDWLPNITAAYGRHDRPGAGARLVFADVGAAEYGGKPFVNSVKIRGWV